MSEAVLKKHAGDVMADLLAEYGTEYVFGLPGGQTLALYYGILNRSDRIKHILMRDENNAVFAADAYARLTGKIGVCDGTAGCGPLKYASGLAEAYNSSVPLIAMAAEQNSTWLTQKYRGGGPQQADIKNLLAPVTKWQATLPTTNQMPELVQRAAQIATSGRPGPVYIECPFDLFDAEYTGSDYKIDKNIASLPLFRCTPERSAVMKALQMLKVARHPLMVVGGGGWLSGAREEVVELAEKLDMPVATSLSGKGIMPENHPLALGVMGSLGGNAVANHLSAEADVVLLVGYKNSQLATHGWKFPSDKQVVIHIDVDGAEISKMRPVDLGMVGDAKATLRLMLDCMDFTRSDADIHSRIENERALWKKQVAIDTAERAPISPQQVVSVLNEICDENTVIACDASFSCGWASTYFDVYGNRRVLMPRGMSGLGYGLPSSVGAACARPNDTIVVLTGDGGLSYCLGEMATLKEQNLNVKVVVLNNSVLGWIKWYQAAIWNGRFIDVDTTHIDFAAVGRGMGCKGYNLTDPETLKSSLKEILAEKGPAIIDIITSETDACKFTDNPAAVEYVVQSFHNKKAAQ